jgi:hypothetical protein
MTNLLPERERLLAQKDAVTNGPVMTRNSFSRQMAEGQHTASAGAIR